MIQRERFTLLTVVDNIAARFSAAHTIDEAHIADIVDRGSGFSGLHQSAALCAPEPNPARAFAALTSAGTCTSFVSPGAIVG
jgi:hypothetical protein